MDTLMRMQNSPDFPLRKNVLARSMLQDSGKSLVLCFKPRVGHRLFRLGIRLEVEFGPDVAGLGRGMPEPHTDRVDIHSSEHEMAGIPQPVGP